MAEVVGLFQFVKKEQLDQAWIIVIVALIRNNMMAVMSAL